MSSKDHATFGIIGGSGLYAMAGLEDVRELTLGTPFGPHSSGLFVGKLEGRSVAFLARHGTKHNLLPAEINYRANIFAMKVLGVERILSASAVGSMREDVRPRDVVLVDQFIDRGQHRQATFFGDGVVAHISFADPICPDLRANVLRVMGQRDVRVHDRGTYLCMEGPAFSTRAESELYRSWNVDVIGMTNMHEAKLSREAEICYATLALVTDYDCWHEEEEDVSVAALLENLKANSQLAAEVVREVVRTIGSDRGACGCSQALRDALITPADAVPRATLERLSPILGKYVTVP